MLETKPDRITSIGRLSRHRDLAMSQSLNYNLNLSLRRSLRPNHGRDRCPTLRWNELGVLARG
jgi:hypothetical protein